MEANTPEWDKVVVIKPKKDPKPKRWSLSISGGLIKGVIPFIKATFTRKF